MNKTLEAVLLDSEGVKYLEEFANYSLWTLQDDIDISFNRKLKSYLNFYNHQRPHLGLKKDYGQFIFPSQYLNQYHSMC